MDCLSYPTPRSHLLPLTNAARDRGYDVGTADQVTTSKPSTAPARGKEHSFMTNPGYLAAQGPSPVSHGYETAPGNKDVE